VSVFSLVKRKANMRARVKTTAKARVDVQAATTAVRARILAREKGAAPPICE